MPDATDFVIQNLVKDGDRAGQWDSVTPNALDMERATNRRTELRRTYPTEAFRIVPFGTGPGTRRGDVEPGGGIVIKFQDGEASTATGRVFVTAEQAENAHAFGWLPTGRTSGSGQMVEIERASR
jgi:hypothetical protein